MFCFDRDVCWDTAEVLKGKDLFAEGQRQALLDRLEAFDFSVGSGNKLRTFLTRGVGIHHAGLLPRYRRVVETLFQEKLLPVCVCTETLAAGINLPARSVVLTTLVKGPRDKKKLIDAEQRAADVRPRRPAAVRHGGARLRAGARGRREARRWKEKYDSIPEDDERPGADEGEEGAAEEEADAAGGVHVLERRAVRQAPDRAAGEAGEQGAADVAVAGVPAGREPGGRADPRRSSAAG